MGDSIAVLIDAGYLFAAGSIAVWGAKLDRSALALKNSAAVAELLEFARDRAPNAALLRIYWYDGALSNKGPSLEQMNLAQLDNVKLRLGFINSQGQQKGVDSLLVTDLVELARNRSVSDVVLLAGDEDVRIGVQIAPSFGVRVHLLGIEPRSNQSSQLVHEADTTVEWKAATVSKMLDRRLPPIAPAAVPIPAGNPSAAGASAESILDKAAQDLVALLDATAVSQLKAYWGHTNREFRPSSMVGCSSWGARDSVAI